MTLVLCIDDKGGMLFFGKRQSKDRILRQRLAEKVGKSRLLVSPYTAGQFEEEASLTVVPHPEQTAEAGDFVFLENTPLPSRGVERVILYRWNRAYPADRFFPEGEYLAPFTLLDQTDFEGSSHERITEEIWEVNR